MDKEAEHLLAGDDGLLDERRVVDRLQYGRRSKASNILWWTFFSSLILLTFLFSTVVLFLRTVFGYEVVIRKLTLAKDMDLMMYCRSGTAENSSILPKCL